MRREGGPFGINRIYRLYSEEGLTVRNRKARRKAIGTLEAILIEARANARWSLDFVHDQFACGRRFRVLNVVDDVTRECLAAIPDTSISGRRVARDLTALIERRPKPSFVTNMLRDRTDLERHSEVVRRGQGRMALHRARQTYAERLRGKLQRQDAGQVSERDPVSQPGPCP